MKQFSLFLAALVFTSNVALYSDKTPARENCQEQFQACMQACPQDPQAGMMCFVQCYQKQMECQKSPTTNFPFES